MAAGESTVLSVTATNATQVTVTGSDGSSFTLKPNGGTETVTPTTTTTYTAVATGTAGGTVTATTTITIPAASAPTVTITATPTSITSGGSSILSVVAANATLVKVTGSDGSSYMLQPTGGTQTVTPAATTTYTATATGTGGATVSAVSTVTIGAAPPPAPAPTVSIVASPSSIPAGGSAVLSITAANAMQVAVTGTDGSSYIVQAAGGVQTVNPAATTTYTAVATGAGGAKVSATATVTVAVSKTVASIAVAPLNGSISVGATQPFTATATYSDGTTANITSTVSWRTANAAVATVNAAGLATGDGAGSTSVTASTGSVTGMATLAVTASAKTVTSIAVSPLNASVAVGAAQQLVATATYSDGTTAIVTSTVSWMSGNAAVATVNPAGVATGVSAGSAGVSASLSGVTGRGALTVTAAPKVVASIAVTPANVSVTVGATQQLTATATYSDGTTANVTATVSWVSSSPAIATVNAAGLATGVGAGSTSVVASLSGVNGTDALAVAAAAKTVKTIAVTPPGASVVAGATQQLTATATYSDGTTANVSTTVSWVSSNTAVAAVNAAGVATGVAAGSASITASLSGVNGADALTVTAAPKTLSSIAVTPPGASMNVGATQQFTATATYSDGTTANVTSTVSWMSSNPAVATINGAGVAMSVAAGSTGITATLSGVSGTDTLTVKVAPTVSSIAVTPANASFAIGATQQFTATATYSDSTTGDVTSTATWTAANTSVATIDKSGVAQGAAAGTTSVTAVLNGVSGSAPLTVTIVAGTGVNLATWHADNYRSGLNAGEQSLTPANVTPKTFGKLFSYMVDGYVYGTPLVMSNLTVNGSARNVVYAATENDSVYAFDADSYGNGTPLWHVSLLQAGETPLTTAAILPVQGVTSTPVIDATTNTMYVVSVQTAGAGKSSFRLNALDITTGAQKFGGPVTVTASVPGTSTSGNGSVVSLTTGCLQRTGLLLVNGTLYIGIGGCPTGWMMAYNATTLAQTAVFNSSPNLNGEGPYASAGGIWMGGGAPAADSAGNVYVTTGNGPWDGQLAWGDSVLKFNSQLKVQDYFTPDDYAYTFCKDSDLGGGGLLLIPGTTEALAGGKTGKLYLVNTANLGHEQTGDAGATQTLFFESDLVGPYTGSCTDSAGTHTDQINSYENFGTAAYFNGSVYLGVTPTGPSVPAGIRQFMYSGTLTPSTNTTPSIQENSYGTTPFISANGTANGILWMIDHGQPLSKASLTATNATLRAYDINNLTSELYDSGINSGDLPGFGIKFSSPIVANGKVYFGTGHDQVATPNPHGELDVYGLK